MDQSAAGSGIRVPKCRKVTATLHWSYVKEGDHHLFNFIAMMTNWS
jgi:hypothetical protein